MLAGSFAKEMQTTKETIRYYVEEGLLTPKRTTQGFDFTEKDVADFRNIQELKHMGFSIAMIKEIKKMRDQGCGTKEHWELSQRLVREELEKTQNQMQLLTKRESELTRLADTLDELLNANR